MGWKEQNALNRHAAKRLRELLQREPTSKEIAQLRHGEQALKLENSDVAKANQLTSETKKLREVSRELKIKVRAGRKQSRRLRRAAARRPKP